MINSKIKKFVWRLTLCIFIALCCYLLVFGVYLAAGIITPQPPDYSGAEILFDESDLNEQFDSYIDIVLNGDWIDAPENISISGSNIVINSAGAYRLSGELENGSLYIAADGGAVHLLLDGACISNSEIPAVYIAAAEKVVFTTMNGSENSISATVKGGLESAVYSEADVTFNGNGKLDIHSENGIAVNCSANVCFADGDIKISAKENAVKAAYGVSVMGGSVDVISGADGIKTTSGGQSVGRWIGAVNVSGGSLSIESDEDAVSSASIIAVSGGEINIVTGGGSTENSNIGGFGGGHEMRFGKNHETGEIQGNFKVENDGAAGDTVGESVRGGLSENSNVGGFGGRHEMEFNKSSDDDKSRKGLKAETGIYISGGSVTVDSVDDAVHSDGDVTIAGGRIKLLSNGDGVQGDSSVRITGGELLAERCYEGLCGRYIEISGGNVDITASDDGISASNSDNPIAQMGQSIETNLFGTGGKLVISGGDIRITASGDGMDSNGDIFQTGGNVYVSSISNGPDVAIDYDGDYRMSGGELAAFGNGGAMMQTISAEGSDSFAVTIGASIKSGSRIRVLDIGGSELINLLSEYDCSSLVLASDIFEKDMTVTIFVDDSETGSVTFSENTVEVGDSNSFHGGFGAGNMQNHRRPNDSSDMETGDLSENREFHSSPPEMPGDRDENGNFDRHGPPDMNNGEMPNYRPDMDGGNFGGGGMPKMRGATSVLMPVIVSAALAAGISVIFAALKIMQKCRKAASEEESCHDIQK